MSQPPPTNLIICCCHSIYYPQKPPALHLNPTPPPGTHPSQWLLSPFQQNEQTTFLLHAKTSIQLLASTPTALLVFSGGFTDPNVRVSEAASYLQLCEDNKFWGMSNEEELRERILVEDRALDSLQNLVFALLAFWRREGEWRGLSVGVVGLGFKGGRFLGLHIPALGLPLSRVKYIGINPDYMDKNDPTFDEERTKDVIEGERTRGYEVWKGDMLGNGEVLRGKRNGRDYWGTRGVWFVSQEERVRSGVRSEVIVVDGWEEEVLVEGEQPWGA